MRINQFKIKFIILFSKLMLKYIKIPKIKYKMRNHFNKIWLKLILKYKIKKSRILF